MKSSSDAARSTAGTTARSGRLAVPFRAAVTACTVALVAGCGKSSGPTSPGGTPPLTLLAVHPLTIREPSDLTIDETGTILWTVTNHPEKVYRLGLDGHVADSLSYVGQDLEGVAYDRRDHTLWLAEENLRQVVHVDLAGAVLAKYPLGLTGEQNKGLEGICLNDSGTVFVLNEKHPGLFIRLHPDHSIATMTNLTFAGDYSGMTYDVARHCFVIVSDESEGLFLWDETSHVLASRALPFSKPEGVAYDPAANRIYVVSDATNALYVFQGFPALGSADAN
jgi:uncharacterized protein YjiK